MESIGHGNTPATTKRENGVYVNLKGNFGLGIIAHELFHHYQFEKEQGGATIFNEIEAYTYQYQVVDEYNYSLSDDAEYESFEDYPSFFIAKDENNKYAEVYRYAASNIIEENIFRKENFFTAMSLFRSTSALNSNGLYSRRYKYNTGNEKYLLMDFFK